MVVDHAGDDHNMKLAVSAVGGRCGVVLPGKIYIQVRPSRLPPFPA